MAKPSDLYKDSLQSLKGMGNVATALSDQMSKIEDITGKTASEFEDVLDLGQKLLENQRLLLLKKVNNTYFEEELCSVKFVPLIDKDIE